MLRGAQSGGGIYGYTGSIINVVGGSTVADNMAESVSALCVRGGGVARAEEDRGGRRGRGGEDMHARYAIGQEIVNSELESLGSGSRRKDPVKCHGTGVYQGIYTET